MALTCTLAALGCALGGCFTPVAPPPPDNAVSVSLLPASWSGPNLPVVISGVHNLGSLAPSDLMFVVKDSRQVEYFHRAAGTGAAVNGTTVAVAYGDTTVPGVVSVGDGLVITLNSTTPEAFGNGTLDVFTSARALAHIVLPAPPSAASQASITLSAGAWSNGNVTLSIDAATNASAISPTDLRFVALDSGGSLYYSAAADHPHTSGAVTVDVFYNDLTDVGRVSAGDSVRLSISPASSSALAGGLLSVAVSTQELGHATLP